MAVSLAGFGISNVAKLLKLLDSKTEDPESCAELVSVLVQDLFLLIFIQPLLFIDTIQPTIYLSTTKNHIPSSLFNT